MHVLRFGNKLNEEVCRGFIFANLFNSRYLLVRLWWNILVTNLATSFQDLVTKGKNLVALAPVLGAISRPVLIFLPFQIMEYYFEERLHILQCTKFLLSYWQDPRHQWRVSWISINFYHFRSIVILNTVCHTILMMFVWIITKTKFILTISIQYQANKWWE